MHVGHLGLQAHGQRKEAVRTLGGTAIGASMKRIEALALAVACFFMVTAGLTWKFGYYGLVGSGAVTLVLLLFVDTDKTDKEE